MNLSKRLVYLVSISMVALSSSGVAFAQPFKLPTPVGELVGFDPIKDKSEAFTKTEASPCPGVKCLDPKKFYKIEVKAGQPIHIWAGSEADPDTACSGNGKWTYKFIDAADSTHEFTVGPRGLQQPIGNGLQIFPPTVNTTDRNAFLLAKDLPGGALVGVFIDQDSAKYYDSSIYAEHTSDRAFFIGDEYKGYARNNGYLYLFMNDYVQIKKVGGTWTKITGLFDNSGQMPVKVYLGKVAW